MLAVIQILQVNVQNHTVRPYRVAIQIANGLDLVSLAIDLHFVRFHDFLYGGSNIAKPYIDARFSNASVCGISNGFQQSIVFGIEGQRERTVNNPTLKEHKIFLAMGIKKNFNVRLVYR